MVYLSSGGARGSIRHVIKASQLHVPETVWTADRTFIWGEDYQPDKTVPLLNAPAPASFTKSNNALNGMAPSYLTELLQVKAAGRYAVWTNNQLLLQVPRTKCWTFGDRSFLVAAPKIWNGLPLDIKQSMSVDCFKSTLKTFLFRLAYEQS